jgi:hypothetical protein
VSQHATATDRTKWLLFSNRALPAYEMMVMGYLLLGISRVVFTRSALRKAGASSGNRVSGVRFATPDFASFLSVSTGPLAFRLRGLVPIFGDGLFTRAANSI